MLFNTLSVFGLVTVATAAPHLHSRFEVEGRDTPAARGISWTPRSVVPRSQNSINNFISGFDQALLIQQQTITILQLAAAQQALAQAQLQAEIQLVQAIQEQLLVQQQLQFAIDNIRINTFNNVNSNVNTIAVVVTQVIDNRNSNNRNTRYMVRQIQSNPSASQQIFVVINESSSMTINGIPANVPSVTIPSPTVDGAAPSGTATAQTQTFAAPQFGSYTPGGNLSLQASGINLLPVGVAAPTFQNARNFIDPALIIQPTQQLFVSNQNQQQFVVISVS